MNDTTQGAEKIPWDNLFKDLYPIARSGVKKVKYKKL